MSEPKRYFDPVRNAEVVDYRGTQDLPPRPASVRCDFCGALRDRLWCYQTRPFDLTNAEGPDFSYSGGSWNACAACNPYLGAGDVAELVAHVLVNNPAVQSGNALLLYHAYKTLFSSMTDRPPIEWHSGDLFPVEFP